MIMTEAIHKYQANGGHWFDRDTMEFWGSSANAELALKVYLRFNELYKGAGFREREVLNNAEKIVPFEAPKPHDCYTIIDTKGNSCTYDFSSKTFIN